MGARLGGLATVALVIGREPGRRWYYNRHFSSGAIMVPRGAEDERHTCLRLVWRLPRNLYHPGLGSANRLLQ